jgi:hypothetical protein
MGSDQDRANLVRLDAMYPGADIRLVSARECRENAHMAKSMDPMFKIIDSVDVVAIAAYDEHHVTAGVFSEAQHALHQGKTVLLMSPEGAKIVRSLHPIRDAGKEKRHSANWARLITQ